MDQMGRHAMVLGVAGYLRLRYIYIFRLHSTHPTCRKSNGIFVFIATDQICSAFFQRQLRHPAK